MNTLASFLILITISALCGTDRLIAADYRGVKIIAHRGAGFEAEENTVEACRQSFERGIRGYEVDVRQTRDGHLVLMHDATVTRTTGATGSVEEMTLAEVRALKTREKGVPVPTIEDLFTFFQDKPDVYLMLEMKTTDAKRYPDEAVEPYCRKLYETAKRMLPEGTFCFISFDKRALAAIHKISHNAFTGYLTSSAPTEEMIAEAKNLGCGRMSVPIEKTPREMARKIRDSGLQLSLWPIRTLEDADLAALWGAAILCTDTPSDLLSQSVRQP